MIATETDVAAPRWLTHLLRTTPAPFPWSRAARAAVALATPLLVALLLGDLATGGLISIGALPTVLADSIGTYRYRARRLAGAVTAAIVGYCVGMFTISLPAVSFVVVVLMAAVSAFISTAGSNASIAGLQLFIFTVVAAGQQAGGVPVGVTVGFFAAGAVWGTTVQLSGWPVKATSPERESVAQVYIELAGLLSATDEPTARAARHQLTTAMNTAYDRLLTARSWLSGRDATYRDLLDQLAAATPTVEAAVAMLNAGVRAPAEAVEDLQSVATAVLAGTDLPPAPPAPEGSERVTALYAGLTKIRSGATRTRNEQEPLLRRLREWLSSIVAGPLTSVAALRLTICVALAETVSLVVPFQQSYWTTLTVGIVLKPDFGSVFGRAVLRGIGTVVGVSVGAVVLATASTSGATAWIIVVLVVVFAGGIPFGKVRNYAVMTSFVTPLIILELELSAGGDWSLVLARLINTVIGCAIVLIFGYLLWPGSLRPRVGGRLADMADTVSGYVQRGMVPPDASPPLAERSRSRRHAYRGLADLRTAFQQAVVEPSAAGRQASAWWPAIVGLERVTDAVTEVAVSVRHGAPAPAPDDVTRITAALGEFAAAVREERRPRKVDMPGTEQLRGVADQLMLALEAVRGPRFRRTRRGLRRRGRRRRTTSG